MPSFWYSARVLREKASMRLAKYGIIPPMWWVMKVMSGYLSNTPPYTSRAIASEVSNGHARVRSSTSLPSHG